MRRLALALVVALGLVFSPAAAQDRGPPRDAALERLVGAWSGEGQVGGKDALVFAGFTWALGERFLALSFARTGGGGAYEAQAYLRPRGGGRYGGTWLDSTGEVTSFEARAEGDSLTLEWAHDVAGPERIVLSLEGPGRLVMASFERRGTAWEPAGRVVLTREQGR
ncbi:MAG: hypothetical protein KIT58_13245 [Planctomycetota bacterium]|nr:hypothetical protein [Planctomycetota bacterium]